MPYIPSLIDPRPAGAQARPPLAFEPRTGVLLRSVNWLGDLLMTLPATWQLKRLLPAGTPLWALSPAALAPVWQAAPWIDGVIPFGGRHPDRDVCAAVRERRFGLAVVMPNSFGSAADVWKCGIPRRFGRSGNWRGLLLTDRIRPWPRGKDAPKCHQLSYYLELVAAFGKAAFNAEYPPLKVASDYAESLGIRKGGGWLALSPGAAFGPAKQWPPEEYAKVAAVWLAHGGQVVLLGSAKDAEATAAVKALQPACRNLAGQTNLPQLMSLLANADAALANDSGAMHLAAALGTPGVAVFLSTDNIATGPLGAPWELFVADVLCRPCLKRECPRTGEGHYACRRAIDAAKVAETLLKLRPRP